MLMRSSPVSYTHLDVYKRQLYILALAVSSDICHQEEVTLIMTAAEPHLDNPICNYYSVH